jgi:hypothetical protein
VAFSPKMSNVGANTAADALTALLNNGYLRLYDGTQPATADTAITTQTLLSTLRFGATAFAAASAGVAVANAIAQDPSAAATGTATWFRALKSDGTTVVFDGAISTVTGTADLVLTSDSITMGAIVTVNGFTYQQAKG